MKTIALTRFLTGAASLCALTLLTGCFESKAAFPVNGKLVAEVYDQMQTFDTTFKLENISLLGTPLNAK